jgi:hypothetical protein
VPLLDLHGFATSAGAGSLTMYVPDIDYTSARPQRCILPGASGGTQPSPGASVSYAMYTDDANVLFATTDLIGSGVMVGTPFADAFAGSATTTDTFSMTLAVVVTHGGTSFSSFDFEGEAPEPGTLALLGAGLVGLAALRQRKPG